MMWNPLTFMYRLYRDGLRQMTWGRQLWLLVIVKLLIIFGILKVVFFRASAVTL